MSRSGSYRKVSRDVDLAAAAAAAVPVVAQQEGGDMGLLLGMLLQPAPSHEQMLLPQ